MVTLDHGCDLGAAEFDERLDVEVIGGEQQLQQLLLVGQVDELLVPRVHQILQRVLGERLFYLGRVVGLVVLAELNDLPERSGLDIGQVDLLLDPRVLDHVLQQLRFLGHRLLDLELALVRRNQDHLAHLLIIKE